MFIPQQQQQGPPPSSSSSGAVATSSPSSASDPSSTSLPPPPSRLAARIAAILLAHLQCPACRSPSPPIDPVSLPCGHHVCAPCLYDRARAANRAALYAVLRSRSLAAATTNEDPYELEALPPRLPLCSGSLPCPVQGCPRSAIGRGIGIWSGYQVRYGPLPITPSTDAVSAWTAASLDGHPAHPPSHLPNPYTSVPLPPPVKLPAAGTPPFDGFIVGVPDHPTNLAILPAQPSKAPVQTASLASSPFSAAHRAGGSGNAIAMHALINDQPTTSRSGIAAATHGLPLDPAATGTAEDPRAWNTIRTDVALAKVLALLQSHLLLAESRAEAEAKAATEQAQSEEEREKSRHLQVSQSAIEMPSAGKQKGKGKEVSRPASTVPSNRSRSRSSARTGHSSGPVSASMVLTDPSSRTRRHSLSSTSSPSSTSYDFETHPAEAGPSSSQQSRILPSFRPNQHPSVSAWSQPNQLSNSSQPMATSTSLPGYASIRPTHPDIDSDFSPMASSRPNLVKHSSTASAHPSSSSQHPLSHPPSQHQSTHHRAHHHMHHNQQAHTQHRHRPALPSSLNSRRQSTHVRLSHDRVAVARSALPLLGQSEEGRESGAAGGIRAVSRSNDSATPSGSEMDSDDGGGNRILNRARRIHHIRRRLGIRGRVEHGGGSGRMAAADSRRRNMHGMFASDVEEDHVPYGGGDGLQEKRDSVRSRFGYRSGQTSESPDIGAAWSAHSDARFDDSGFDRKYTATVLDDTAPLEDHNMDVASPLHGSPSGAEPMNISSPEMTGAISLVGGAKQMSRVEHTELAERSVRSPLVSSSDSKDSSETQSSSISEQQEIGDLQTALLDVFECQLCYLLLYEPLTTPCGHTFCRACFARNLDHSDRCPLCRSRMPSWGFWQDHPTNHGLMSVINLQIDQSTPTGSEASVTAELDDAGLPDGSPDSMTSHGDLTQRKMDAITDERYEKSRSPEVRLTSPSGQAVKESGAQSSPSPRTAVSVGMHGMHNVKWELPSLYLERRLAAEADEAKARLSTPIFVCTLAYPDMPTVLHIYEPRYRLMIRRCLESGNPRFGMVMPARTSSPNAPGMYEYGTMLEIRSVQMLPDGRSMLETVGSYRFRVFETGTLDGYTVGRVERIEDVGVEEDLEMERTFVELANRAARAAGAVEPVPRTATSSQDQSAADRSHVPATDQAGYVLGLDVGVADAFLRASENGQTAGTGEGTGPSLPGAASAVAVTDVAGAVPSSALPMTGMPMVRSESGSEASMGTSSASTFGDSLPPMLAAAHPSTDELVDVCTSFIEVLRSGSAPLLLTRLNQSYGPMPSRDEIGRLAYWMALVIPIDEHEKARLLSIRSARLRLRLVVHWIEQLRSSWWFASGCTVC